MAPVPLPQHNVSQRNELYHQRACLTHDKISEVNAARIYTNHPRERQKIQQDLEGNQNREKPNNDQKIKKKGLRKKNRMKSHIDSSKNNSIKRRRRTKKKLEMEAKLEQKR